MSKKKKPIELRKPTEEEKQRRREEERLRREQMSGYADEMTIEEAMQEVYENDNR